MLEHRYSKRIAMCAALVAFVSLTVGFSELKEDCFVDELQLELGNPFPNDIDAYMRQGLKERKSEKLKKKAKLIINDNSQYPGVGKHVVLVQYGNKEEEINVFVKDTVQPNFVDFPEKIETYTTLTPDYEKMFTAKDLTETKIEIDDSFVDYDQPGEYKIHVTAFDQSYNSKMLSAVVTVKAQTIKLDKSSIKLIEGESDILNPEIDGISKKVEYISENKDIATVDADGKVTAIKSGKTKIKATANNISTTCDVVVEKKPEPKKKSSKGSYATPPTKAPDDNHKTNVSNIPSGGGIKIKTKKTCALPESIPQGKLNEQQHAIANEILEICRTSNEEVVELKTLLLGSIDDAKEIFDVLKDHVGVKVSFRSLSKCREDGVCYGSGDNPYVKIKINPLTTRNNIKERNKEIDLVYNALSSAGVKNGISEKEAVLKISKWICKKMTYKINGGDAYVGFTTGQGQCATYADMFNEMCEAAGLTCKIVGGDAGGPHAWNQVKVSGTWYYVDVTWADSTGNSKYILSKKLWSSHTIG